MFQRKIQPGDVWQHRKTDPWSEPALVHVRAVESGWVRFQTPGKEDSTALEEDVFRGLYRPV